MYKSRKNKNKRLDITNKPLIKMSNNKQVKDQPSCKFNVECSQINLQHSQIGMTELNNRCVSRHAKSVFLLSEPLVRKGRVIGVPRKSYNVYHNSNNKKFRSCILVNKSLVSWSMDNFCNEDVTVVMLKGDRTNIVLCNYYADIEINKVNDLLEKLCQHCDQKYLPLIICSDSNAHSFLWGCEEENNRGLIFNDFIAKNQLNIINNGNDHTFVSTRARSIIDITLANDRAVNLIDKWKVDKKWSGSDHKYIEFNINKNIKCDYRKQRNFRKVNWEEFRRDLPEIDTEVSITKEAMDLKATEIQKGIISSLDKHCPEKTILRKDPVPWWNKDIEKKVKRLKIEYRRIERFRKKGIDQSEYIKKYNTNKTELRRMIKKSKKESWKSFCDNLNSKEIARLTRGRKTEKTVELLKDKEGNRMDDLEGSWTSSSRNISRDLQKILIMKTLNLILEITKH